MKHDGECNSKKQKCFDASDSEKEWIFVTVATADVYTTFHMIEIHKETHREIYEDLTIFDLEDVEIRMDFHRDISPFTKLKSGNYATQENYTDSKEWKRWFEFYETFKNNTGILCSCKNLKEITSARFWVLIEIAG